MGALKKEGIANSMEFLITKKYFFAKNKCSHQVAKTQRKNAKHFSYFVPWSLRGKPCFWERSSPQICRDSCRKVLLLSFIELKKIYILSQTLFLLI
jgi:hypothetical protein